MGVAQPVHRDRKDQPEAEDHPGGVRLQPGPRDEQVKITFPSPLLFYSAWSPELSTAVYKDAYELFADAAAIIRAEIEALAALGCTYIQIDSPDIGTPRRSGEP